MVDVVAAAILGTLLLSLCVLPTKYFSNFSCNFLDPYYFFQFELYRVSHSSLVDYLAQVINVKKLSHYFLLHSSIGMGSYDHHAKYQGVFP